ncbi:MAG: stage II sporulation protein R, partial [Acutalibacteraceae bacterium]
MNRIKALEIAAFVAFALAVIISTASFEKDCEGVRTSVLRLHVIANSDSQEDQALKLQVRDAILKKGRQIFGNSSTKQSAEKYIGEHTAELEEAAQAVIEENGYDYPVKVELGESYFPTKTYENVTLPAGTYDAVRVIIGSGEGKNWWCVMFPPLCLPAACGDTELSDVMNEDEL